MQLDKTQWHSEMNSLAATVQRAMRVALKAGLSTQAVSLAAQIGVLSFMRVDGVPEDLVIQEAKKATPRPTDR